MPRVAWQPQRYAEAPEELPGFLRLPQPKHAAPIRLAALDRLAASAASRQAAAAAELAADRAAAQHHVHLLARRALAALRLAVVAAQGNARLAAQHRKKQIYCRHAAAFAAWRAAAATRRRLLAKAGEAEALRRHTLAAHALAALHRHAARRRAKRHSWAQAESFHAFCLLTRGALGWRAVVRRHAALEQLTAAAVLHWATRLASRALALWCRYRQQRQERRQRAELAAACRRHAVLGAVLGAWADLIHQLAARRQAAAHTIQQALFGSPHQLAGMCLRAWRLCTQRRQRQRDDRALAGRYHRAALLGAAWRG